MGLRDRMDADQKRDAAEKDSKRKAENQEQMDRAAGLTPATMDFSHGSGPSEDPGGRHVSMFGSSGDGRGVEGYAPMEKGAVLGLPRESEMEGKYTGAPWQPALPDRFDPNSGPRLPSGLGPGPFPTSASSMDVDSLPVSMSASTSELRIGEGYASLEKGGSDPKVGLTQESQLELAVGDGRLSGLSSVVDPASLPSGPLAPQALISADPSEMASFAAKSRLV